MQLRSLSCFWATMLLTACHPYYDQLSSKTPQELAAMSDNDMCLAHSYYQNSNWPLPLVKAEFEKRGIVCGTSGLYEVVIGYTPERLARQDDATCLSYGAKPDTTAYTNCRLQLKAQRENAVLNQQAIQAQRDANSAAAYQNLTATGLRIMQQSQQASPFITNTNCNRTMMGINCTTY